MNAFNIVIHEMAKGSITLESILIPKENLLVIWKPALIKLILQSKFQV